MKPRKRVAVLVASENRLFRESLNERIGRDIRFRVVASSAESGLLADIKSHRPDLLVIDLDEVGAAPESLLVRLRSVRPQLRILALVSRQNEGSLARILRYGASGTISKDENIHTLLRAMAAVAAGETFAPPRAIAQALSNLVEERRQDTASSLTMRERQLLSLLGEGYRNKELASLLRIKEQTVKIHLHSLFRKLNVRTRVEAALKAAQG